MKLFYADHFVLPLPEGHRFPMEKYSLLRKQLMRSGGFSPDDFVVPPAAGDSDILRAHDAIYLDGVVHGTLDQAEQRRIGFPWSRQMVERSRRSAGATLAACRQALVEGCAANLAGGTHHAHRDFGSGFCVFNDAAIAALSMRAEGRARSVAIIDCDVHQGDGTAAILSGDPDAFTLSIHGEKNFPFRKARSTLDIELPDGTGDATYLAALGGGLEEILEAMKPDLAIYLAGADPYRDDRLGRLGLSFEGLAARDEMVLRWCVDHGTPVAIAMAGGYARIIEDTVAIHAATIATAARFSPALQAAVRGRTARSSAPPRP
ncbi:histone deacetylase family protein [Aromatoleum petrolei]|uniref:Histone deacetylase n=1 Tax=Aromatoleum petrolei TaxID=76116 RepID=A0ABX1MJT3_9RHOO|nr:histone deacetylase [Aromatoleum petrolei]NMF88219.1 histone deacetylase [Aromatoleum petrolei]QTQ38080.1 Histone deacetylase family protein [Aromatoleum petrolei]